MTTPYGAESDAAGFPLGRGEYQPEDMVLSGIDAVTGGDDHPLNEVSPPPGVVMPKVLNVEVPEVHPGEEVRPGAIKPENNKVRDLDDLLAAIDTELNTNGVDWNRHFPPYRDAGHMAITGFEGHPQDDPNAPGVAQ